MLKLLEEQIKQYEEQYKNLMRDLTKLLSKMSGLRMLIEATQKQIEIMSKINENQK